MRLPTARILPFELDENAREQLRELAEQNHVTNRVQIDGRCTPERLEFAIGTSPATAIICDVEGYESELLDPDSVPSLRHCIILVETHPHLSTGIVDLMQSRFESTHDLTTIECKPRVESDFDVVGIGGEWLPKSYKRSLVIERGPLTPWILMKPIQHAPQH